MRRLDPRVENVISEYIEHMGLQKDKIRPHTPLLDEETQT